MAYSYFRSHDPALVLVHGAWCDADDWNPVIPSLPPDQSVLTFDLRGHGRSDNPLAPVTFDDLVDDIAALVDHLGLGSPVLVGHSLGGMLSMRLAERHPGRTCGIALAEGWTWLGVPWEARHEMYGMLPHAIIERIKGKWDAAQRRWPEPVLTGFWDTVRQANASHFLETTRLPVLEVYGDRGKPRPAREKLSIPDRPNIRLAWVEDAGHYLSHEQPRLLGDLITEWLVRNGLVPRAV